MSTTSSTSNVAQGGDSQASHQGNIRCRLREKAANLSHLDLNAAQQYQQQQASQAQQSSTLAVSGTPSLQPTATPSASVSASCLNDESSHSNRDSETELGQEKSKKKSRRRKKTIDKQPPKVTIISYDQASDEVEVLLEVSNNNLTCKFPRNSIPRAEEVEEDLLPDVSRVQIEGVTGLLHQVIQIVTKEGKNAVGQVLTLSPSSSPTAVRKFKINIDPNKGAQELKSQTHKSGLVVTHQSSCENKINEDDLEETTTSPENNPEGSLTHAQGMLDMEQKSWKSTTTKESVPINIDELSEKLKSIYPQKTGGHESQTPIVKPADAGLQGQPSNVSQPPQVQTSQGLAYPHFQGQAQATGQAVPHLAQAGIPNQLPTGQSASYSQGVPAGGTVQMQQPLHDHSLPAVPVDTQVSPKSAAQMQAGHSGVGQHIPGHQTQYQQESSTGEVPGPTATASVQNIPQDPAAKAGGLPTGYSSLGHMAYGMHPQVSHLSQMQQMQQMYALMHMAPYTFHQPSYYAHMTPYMQTMMQMSHFMHQMQQHQQQHGQHPLPMHLPFPYSQYSGWGYPSTVGLPPQSSHPPESSSVSTGASPPRSPTSSRRNVLQDISVQSPYASIENLSNIGRSMPRSDINTLEQALAKTMSRQNHPHQHNPSPISSGTSLQDVPADTKLTDHPPDVTEKLKPEDDKILIDKGTLPDGSPPRPAETKSEPELSVPKVKAISRFKVETVKEDPLLVPNDAENKATSPEGDSSKTDVTEEKTVDKRGRFQVTKITVKPPADSASSEGTSADATSSASSNTKPNVSDVSSAKQEAVDATTNFQLRGEGASDNTKPVGTVEDENRPVTPGQKTNPEKIKNDLAALEFDAEYQALIDRQIEEKRVYLTNKGYDQEVIDFEVLKVRQPHPLLASTVGSPAFLNVSPPFAGQPSPPVPLFHLGGDQNFAAVAEAALAKSPLRVDILRAGKTNRLEDLKDLLKYVDFTAQTSVTLPKGDVKKSMNEMRQEQEPRWENNFDSVGSSGVGSSMGTEYLDLTRDTSASNSRKSSIDLSGSQNSISDLLHSYQQQQQFQASAVGQTHIPSAPLPPVQQNTFEQSQVTSTQQQIPHQAYSTYYTGQYPFSIHPFPGFQFPVASQQGGYHPAALAPAYSQFLGNTGAFTVQPGFQPQQGTQDSAHAAISKSATTAVSGIPNAVAASTVNQHAVAGVGQSGTTSPNIQPVVTSAASAASSTPAPSGPGSSLPTGRTDLTPTQQIQSGQPSSG
ncbi:unnamed protein product [Candidula unifasciata]|uniref:Uncharacterized protein n=1 Tax=Candidula unifasciata TaxID=100452 RepID=A0A8S3ZM58_9EUPU|nr:unnamed protein product [Candidula unifasciata]